jgi:hypothetical protein
VPLLHSAANARPQLVAVVFEADDERIADHCGDRARKLDEDVLFHIARRDAKCGGVIQGTGNNWQAGDALTIAGRPRTLSTANPAASNTPTSAPAFADH